MKKFLISLLACLCIGTMAVGISACSDDEDSVPTTSSTQSGADTGNSSAQSHTHNYQTLVVIPATCGQVGYTYYYCDGCGETYSEEIPMIGHNWGDWTPYGDTQGVACDQTLQSRICSTCNDIEWRSAPHTWGAVQTVVPTCTQDGYDSKTCTVCGEEERSNYVSATHTWGASYSGDNSFHWIGCVYCDEIKDKAEHTLGEDGICTVCGIPVGATEGIVYDLSADGMYAEVIDYTGTATKVRIADTYNGVPVTGIYANAFEYADITTVIIPDSVQSIGEGAFAYCTSLTSVEIGDSVQSIGDCAFYYCDSLTSVEIPDSVQSISSFAFYYCDSLTSVYITDIAAWCNITFGNSSASPLSNGAKLYINNEIITELIIPDTVTEIKAYAFFICTSLTSVVIPDSVQSIGSYAFSSCYSLTSVEIGDSVQSIGSSAFDECTSLTSVVIPDSVQSIGEYAFDGCDNLQYTEYGNCKYLGNSNNAYHALIEVTNTNYSTYSIHENTKVIANYAFSGCSRMTSITIPDSVQSIGKGAFSGCSSLQHITIPFVGAVAGKTASDTYQYPFGYIFGESSYTGGTETRQYYYGSSTSSTTYSWYYIPTSLQSVRVTGGNILYGAFDSCDSLTSVEIGDSVQSIGDSAFSSCTSLTSVYITDIAAWCNITFGGYSANPLTNGANLYVNNELITELIIPDTVTEIKAYAFAWCNSLTSVEIGDSVQSIGSSAFYECTSLTSVEIGDSVQSIGEYAFRNCTSLTSVEIGDSVQSIGDYAFYACTSLTEVYYKGTASEWWAITIDNTYGYNNNLTAATRYYYSEEQPTESGNYWHYVDGVVTKWESV